MSDFPFRKADRSPLAVAHRGAPTRALENSIASFAAAVADGADMIEFDVRLSSDGVPFVLHDARTGRTARENVAVARCDAARLGRVRLKNGEPIPSLAEVLALVRGAVPLNIETKSPGAMAAVCGLLSGSRYGGPVLLSSGLRAEVRAAREIRPAVPCGLVTGRPSASDLAFCLRNGLASIHPDHRTLTVVRLKALRASGLAFLPYTVDDPTRFFELADAGADGVFSNRAGELRAAWAAARRGSA